MFTFSSLGQGLIGIFFPFFIKENFNLEDYQVLLYLAICLIILGVTYWPVNKIATSLLGVRKTIALGLFCHACFFSILGLELNSPLAFWSLWTLFILNLLCFWPSFNALSANHTTQKNRGDFWGTIQMFTIGVGIVAPFITGWLLEIQQASWILGLSVIFFCLAIIAAFRLPVTELSMHDWATSRRLLRNVFLDKDKGPGFAADGILSVTMWMVWPFYFKAVLGSYSLMGMVTSIAAFFEMFIARIMGKLTDKHSATHVLKYGVWARCLDLSLRSVYFWSTSLFVVMPIQLLGGILGPLFQISAMTKIIEVGRAQKENLLDFFVAREIALQLTRAPLIFLASWVCLQWGAIYLAPLFILSGLTAFAFKKL